MDRGSKATLPLTIPRRVFKSSAKDSTRRSVGITFHGGPRGSSAARASPTTRAFGGDKPLAWPWPGHALTSLWPGRGLATPCAALAWPWTWLGPALALDLAWPWHCHAFGPRVQWPAIPCLSCTFGFSLLGQGKAGYTFGFSFLGQGRAGYTFCLGPALHWSWSWSWSWTWPWTPPALHGLGIAMPCLGCGWPVFSFLGQGKAGYTLGLDSSSTVAFP